MKELGNGYFECTTRDGQTVRKVAVANGEIVRILVLAAQSPTCKIKNLAEQFPDSRLGATGNTVEYSYDGITIPCKLEYEMESKFEESARYELDQIAYVNLKELREIHALLKDGTIKQYIEMLRDRQKELLNF